MTVNEALAIVGLKERDSELLIDVVEEKIFTLTRPLLSNKPVSKIVRSRINKIDQLAEAANVLDPAIFSLQDKTYAIASEFNLDQNWTEFISKWNDQLLVVRRGLANTYRPHEVIELLNRLLVLAEIWDECWKDYFPEPPAGMTIPALSANSPIDTLNLVKAFMYLQQCGVSCVMKEIKKSYASNSASDLDQKILLPLFQEKLRSNSKLKDE